MDNKNIITITILPNIKNECLNDEIINSSYFIPNILEVNNNIKHGKNTAYKNDFNKYVNNYFSKCTE